MANNPYPRTKLLIKQIKDLTEQGLSLRQCATELGKSYESVKQTHRYYISEHGESPILGDCVTHIAALARQRGETEQSYLYFIKRYNLTASTALKVITFLRERKETTP